ASCQLGYVGIRLARETAELCAVRRNRTCLILLVEQMRSPARSHRACCLARVLQHSLDGGIRTHVPRSRTEYSARLSYTQIEFYNSGHLRVEAVQTPYQRAQGDQPVMTRCVHRYSSCQRRDSHPHYRDLKPVPLLVGLRWLEARGALCAEREDRTLLSL